MSVLLEFLLLVSIYTQFPGLSEQKPTIAEEGGRGIFKDILGFFRCWIFFQHNTLPAGLGLALLYMTMLGFDNTTWSFVLMQFVSVSVLGGLVAVSSVLGLLGSVAFPPLRQLLGVAGMVALVTSLSLCVVSVWLPGSPFNPFRTRFQIHPRREEASVVEM